MFSRPFIPALFTAITLCSSLPAQTPSSTIRAEPPVVFSVQPEEDGRLVYLPVAPETPSSPGRNLLGLHLNIQNNDTNDLTLRNLRLVFRSSDGSTFARSISRDVAVPAGESRANYISPQDPDETFELFDPPPSTVDIELYFDGFSLPKTVQRRLAPYVPSNPRNLYFFPGNASDLQPDQYWSHIVKHTGGSQFFGYDFHVQGWDASAGKFSPSKPGGGNANEDRLGWNIPIYSMADGTVISVSTGWEDNPAPGKRSIQRMGEAVSGPVTDVKVTRFSATRAATVVILPNGNLGITIWDLEDNGRQIIQRGSVQAESVREITADALTGSRLLTAVRTSTGALRVIVWDVSGDGMTITRAGERDASTVEEVSLVKVTTSRFATAVRQEGALRLILWSVSGDGATISILDHAFAGTASSVSVAALKSDRLVTSLRSASGALLSIVWDILEEPATALDRKGDAAGGLINQVVAVNAPHSDADNPNLRFDTAARRSDDTLEVIRWEVSVDGLTINSIMNVDAGPVQDLAAVPTFDDAVVTTVVTATGTLKHIVWLPDEDNNTFNRWAEAEAGAANPLHVDETDTGLLFTGLRTAEGDLKVITWWIGHGGGNNLVILHGDCRVLYAHFKHDTIDPAVAFPGARVTAGQFLGRMGNSGSSAGPHLHIHSSRISSLLSIEEIISLESKDELEVIAFRPIPFHCALALQLNAIQPGGRNTFFPLENHGIYFQQYGILPTWLHEAYVDGASTCISPTGQQVCIPGPGLMVGGPFHTVAQALAEPCWAHTLFIRAGSYNESVVFDRPMIVRSYDGIAVIGE